MIGKKINQLATELAPVSTDLTIIGDPTTGVSKKITLAQLGAIFSGAVSFYTNLAGFPAVGDINVIYCAKDTQKLYLWSGSAYTEVFPSQALLDTYQLRSEKGNANGYASLDSQGKVPISQLPSSIMEYKGTWNASTNTPTLANGTGDTGDVYICNVAGTVNFGAGPITFAVGDYVIYSGTIWQRSSGAVGTVTSVSASITGDSVTISGSPVTTSGTLAFAFAGTGAQYIKGDGTLATFPNTIDQAKNLITEVYNKTGATLTKGTVVYINGGQGNLPAVTKALATGDSTSAQTYGIVRNDITNNNNGYVVVAGRISDLDTQAYTEGTQLYLSSTTAGAYTSTKQYAPAHLVYVGIVVRAHPTQGVIEVKIQNGYELDELHNVAAQTPTNNDGLFWEASTSLWKNKSIATILGYTPQAQLNGTGFVKASGTSITYDNSTYLTTSAAATTYLPLVLSSTTNFVDINGQQFSIYGSAGGYTSGRIIVDPVFSAIGYQNAGVFDGLKILTNGNAEFSNSGITRFFNQVRFDSTLTNGTYTYTLPGATGTIALTSDLTGGTVTSVGLSSATSGVTIGSTPITTSGTITLAIATASGSQQGLLSSTDWTTFNNKQNALTNPVTGTGTTNYLPKFTGTSTIGNSVVFDNSGNINIGGTSGLGKLSVYGANAANTYMLIDNAGSGINYYAANNFHEWQTAGSTRMTLNASGNLGLGVTPSAWGSGRTALQIGNTNSYFIGSQNTVFGNNAYNDGSNWRYITSYNATLFTQAEGGSFAWYTAPSGTAGNAISFTQAMTLTANGDLGVGTTSPNYTTSGRKVIAVDGSSSAIYALQNSGTSAGYLYGDGGNVILWAEGSRNLQLGGASTGSIFFTPNNSNAMIVTSAGSVGIGTTSPSFLLDVRGTAAIIQAKATGTTGSTYSGLLLGSPAMTWNILNDDNGGGGKLRIYNDYLAADAVNIMKTTNYVGIGTTAPAKTLTVVNTAEQLRISYASGVYTDFRNDSAGGLLINTSGGYIINYIGGTERLRIKTNTINISSIPTSSAGLSSGDLYSSAGVLMIV